jgi:hypothetical protein
MYSRESYRRRLDVLRRTNPRDPEITEIERLLSQRSELSLQLGEPVRYRKEYPAAWFAAFKIFYEPRYESLNASFNPPYPEKPAQLNASNAYEVFGIYQKMFKSKNNKPSELIQLTSIPSLSVEITEDYLIVFSINYDGTITYHRVPPTETTALTLFVGQAIPTVLYDGIIPKNKNGILTYTSKLNFFVGTKKIIVRQTQIVRTSTHPDVEFDGRPLTITLPVYNGEWSYGNIVLSKSNTIQIETIANPDKNDLSLRYDFVLSGNNESITVRVIYRLRCLRCSVNYTRNDNYHGACVWHPRHGEKWRNEYEAELETLDKFAAGSNIEEQTLSRLIKKSPSDPLLATIQLKLIYIQQKFGDLPYLSDVSEQTIGRIRALAKQYAQPELPYDLIRIMKRLLTSESVSEILNPLYFDIDDPITHPTRPEECNPNKHYGIYRGVWLCCGQKDSKGCMIGWHSHNFIEPSLTHIAFRKTPFQCSEYVNDPNTSRDVYIQALDAYRRGDKTETVMLELKQNRIYGGALEINFAELDRDQRRLMREQVFTGDKFTGVDLQQNLEEEVKNGEKITNIWVINLNTALMIPNGTTQRYITDVKYVERLVAVVELTNESKGSKNPKQLLYDKLVDLFPREKASFGLPLTPEEQKWKAQIDTILKNLSDLRNKYTTRVLQLAKFWYDYRAVKEDIEKEEIDGENFTDTLTKELKLDKTNTLPTSLDDTWFNEAVRLSAGVKYDQATLTALAAHEQKFNVLDESVITEATQEMLNNTLFIENAQTKLDELKSTIDLLREKAKLVLQPFKDRIELSKSFKKISPLPKDDAALILYTSMLDKKTIEVAFNDYFKKFIKDLTNLPPKLSLDRDTELAKYDAASEPILELMKSLGVNVPTDEIKRLSGLYEPVLNLGKRLENVGEEVNYTDVQSEISKLSTVSNEKMGDAVFLVEEAIKTANKRFNQLAIQWLERSAHERVKYIKKMETFLQQPTKSNQLLENFETALNSTSAETFWTDTVFDNFEKMKKELEEVVHQKYKVEVEFYDALVKLAAERNIPYTREYNATTAELEMFDYERIRTDAINLRSKIYNFDNVLNKLSENVELALNRISDDTAKKEFVRSFAQIMQGSIATREQSLRKLLAKLEKTQTKSAEEQQKEAKRANDEILKNQEAEKLELTKLLRVHDDLFKVYKFLGDSTWTRPDTIVDANGRIQYMNTEITNFFNPSILNEIGRAIKSMNLDKIKRDGLLDIPNHNVIGVLLNLKKPEQQREFVLFYFVMKDQYEIKKDGDKYVYEAIPNFIVTRDVWLVQVSRLKNEFKLGFNNTVANIIPEIESLEKTAKTLWSGDKPGPSGKGIEEPELLSTTFNVWFDTSTVDPDQANACLAHLKRKLADYNITIGSTEFSGERSYDDEEFKVPTFLLSLNMNTGWIESKKADIETLKNFFYANCKKSKNQVTGITLYSRTKLEPYKKRIEPFKKFYLLYDAGTTKGDNYILEKFLDAVKLRYSIQLIETLKFEKFKQNPNGYSPRILLKSTKNTDVDLYDYDHVIFATSTKSNYTITDDSLQSELSLYENKTKFNVSFTRLYGGLEDNEKGIPKFQKWLIDNQLNYVTNENSPSIIFVVKNTGPSGKVTASEKNIVVPYARKDYGLLRWDDYEIVTAEIPELRLAILRLLADQSPRPSAPPSQPEKEVVVKGSDAPSESTAKRSSNNDPPPVVSDTFENLEQALDHPTNHMRAANTVLRIKSQIDELDANRELSVSYQISTISEKTGKPKTYMLNTRQIPHSVDLNEKGIATRPEKALRYHKYIYEQYYLWCLLLYAMEKSRVVREADFITKLIAHCSNNSKSNLYFKTFANSLSLIELFEDDRRSRLFSDIEKYRGFVDKYALEEGRQTLIDVDKLTSTDEEYFEVPYWVWQPSLFYGYGMLSKALNNKNLVILSDFWLPAYFHNGNERTKSIFNKDISEDSDEMDQKFTEIIQQPKENVDSFQERIETILSSKTKSNDPTVKQITKSKDTIVNILITKFKADFRSGNMYSKSGKLNYTMWSSNKQTFFGWAKMKQIKSGIEIKEIGANYGRLLFLRLWLDSLLFMENNKLQLTLIPKTRHDITNKLGVKGQIFQALPSKLLSVYTSWGFKRNFDILVEPWQLLQNYESLASGDVIDLVGKELVVKSTKTKKTVLPTEFAIMDPLHKALLYLFGFQINADDSVVWLNKDTKEEIFNVFNPSEKIRPIYIGKKIDIEPKISFKISKLREKELAQIRVVADKTPNKILNEQAQIFYFKISATTAEISLPTPSGEAPIVKGSNRKTTIFYDISEIPGAYDPTWISGPLVKKGVFLSKQDEWEKQITKNREDLFNTKPHLTNIEKYALILLGVKHALASRLTYLSDVNIDVQMALDFLESL